MYSSRMVWMILAEFRKVHLSVRSLLLPAGKSLTDNLLEAENFGSDLRHRLRHLLKCNLLFCRSHCFVLF